MTRLQDNLNAEAEFIAAVVAEEEIDPVRAECEAKLDRIMARWGDINNSRKISKLTILALKAMPRSIWQQTIQDRRATFFA